MNDVKMGVDLLKDIKATRKSMVQVGATFGLTHPETIKLSQQLDHLLNLFDNYR